MDLVDNRLNRFYSQFCHEKNKNNFATWSGFVTDIARPLRHSRSADIDLKITNVGFYFKHSTETNQGPNLTWRAVGLPSCFLPFQPKRKGFITSRKWLLGPTLRYNDHKQIHSGQRHSITKVPQNCCSIINATQVVGNPGQLMQHCRFHTEVQTAIWIVQMESWPIKISTNSAFESYLLGKQQNAH